MSTPPLVTPLDLPDLPALAEADAPEGDGDGLAALPDTFDPDPDADADADAETEPNAVSEAAADPSVPDAGEEPHKEIDVLPLPTIFDPDEVNEAPPPITGMYGEEGESLEDLIIASPSKRASNIPSHAEDLSLPPAHEVEDDLESRTGDDAPTAIAPREEQPETEAGGEGGDVQAQELLTGEADGDVEEEEEEEEEEAAKPPELLQILKALHRQEAKDPEPDTTVSSPLSDLPELPSELPPSPKSPTFTSPPPTGPSLNPPSTSLPHSAGDRLPSLAAESSSSAARRAELGSSTTGIKRTVDGEDKLKGASSSGSKGKGKSRKEGQAPIATLASHEGTPASGTDDLQSISGDETEKLVDIKDEGSGVEKRKYKKLKGLDGKAIRTSVKSRKRLDAMLGISQDDKTPEKITPRPKALTDAQIKSMLRGSTRERQMGPCLRPRYAKWGKCTQCVSKVGGDSCRFRDYRVFPIHPVSVDIVGPGWFESTDLKEELTPLPRDFNVPMEEDHILKTERTVAPILLPIINRELRHVVNSKAIKRGVDSAKHRSVCDFCSSTIFSGYWFCKKCGRDFCLQCERYFSDNMETMSKSPWPMADAARPRLLRCNAAVDTAAEPTTSSSTQRQWEKPKGRPAFHFRPDLQPVSRFSEAELRQHWLALVNFVLEGSDATSIMERLRLLGLAEDDEVLEAIKGWVTSASDRTTDDSPTEVLSPGDIERLYTKSTHAEAIPIPDPAGLEEHSHQFIRTDFERLDNSRFDVLWAKGEPMVIDNVDKRLKLSWTPDDFIERFGEEPCVVVDCQTNKPHSSSIRNFFRSFKEADTRGKSILKLKDWPATDDFKNTHPGLYNDFCDALPVPDYTRREGVLNLYAHFPPGPTKPDIGPKMYNAFEAVESTGGFGSTRLHMDVADAINVMLYASPRTDGQPGCAVWDLFRAEDAPKIRAFLHRTFDRTHGFTDPIHSQLFYLDASLRKELWEKEGVVSWRVYQYPGQAVFIPAGCAHQVCNLADCIKIALDFVSPHNVSRCQQLTSDFRNENFVKAWKEDVLQLYNVLWYAWLSSREARDRRIQEEEEKRKVEEARQKHLKSLQDGATHHSPGRSHFWAMSSVRDEEPLREGSVSSRASPAPIPLGRGSADVPVSVPAAVSPLTGRTDAPTNDTSGTGGETLERGAAAAVVEDEALEKKQKLEGPPVDMKQTLALRLLSASLSAPDAPPPPAPRNPSAGSKVPIKRFPSASATTPGSPRVKLEPTRSLRSGSDMGTAGTTEVTRMRDAIKRGHIGVDLMVSVARAEMGLGADRDVDGDGDVEMNMEGMWGDVAQSAQMQLEQREAENEENGKGNAEEVSEGGDEGDDGDAAFTEATREALLKVVAPLQNSGDDDEEMEEDTALAGEGAGELVTAEESEIQ